MTVRTKTKRKSKSSAFRVKQNGHLTVRDGLDQYRCWWKKTSITWQHQWFARNIGLSIIKWEKVIIDRPMGKGDGGKMRPVDPPSVFEGFAQSSIPTPPSKPRPTKTRTRRDDELAEFKKADVIHDFDAFTDELKHNRRKLSANIISFKSDDALWVQSLSYVSGIPSFSIRVSRDLSFQSFFMGIQCTVVTFSKKTVSPE